MVIFQTSPDTALKTADYGYLTRRLVDVSQDIIIRETDCGTDQGIVVKDFVNEKTGSVIESLRDRIVGRYANKKVVNPETKEIIVDRLEMITDSLADKIVKAGVKEVEIRSILTCCCDNGICQTCYGRNLATGNLVEIGDAVGVMAAQSIGEPGTQLTTLVELLVLKILLKVYLVFKNYSKHVILKVKQLLLKSKELFLRLKKNVENMIFQLLIKLKLKYMLLIMVLNYVLKKVIRLNLVTS